MKKIILSGLFVCLINLTFASHLRCGYIVVDRPNCLSKTVIIKIVMFTNTASEVQFGGDGILSFGDGTDKVIPEVSSIPRPDLGPNIGMAEYIYEYTYAASGSYLISYVEPNRNAGVLNMQNSFFTKFYLETKIDLATPGLCTVPVFLATPVFSGFTGSNLAFSLGAASRDDIQVTYEMVVPFQDRGLPVVGYVQPPNMTLNYLTGLLSWETEGAGAGEYNFAVNAIQWIKVGEVWFKKGYTRIDFQVILADDASTSFILHDNQALDEYSRLLVPASEEKKIRVFYEVDNSYNPEVEMFSSLPEAAASFTSYDSVSETSGADIKVGLLTITPREQDVRTHPYLITIRGQHRDNSFRESSDINYLIYTDELPPPPEIITGTEDDVADVQVFPNPFVTHINVRVNRPGASEVLLYTIEGKLIRFQTFESQTELQLQEFARGVYICDIRRNNVSVKKIKLIKY